MRLIVKIKAPQHGLFITNILVVLFAASQLASATTPRPNAASATQSSLSLEEAANGKKNLAAGDLGTSSSSVRLVTAEQKPHDQVASPTMSSVHQVWTSSSSGSLEELSPELIGRLRNDVPFLAAYALRPRLVGSTATLGSDLRRPTSATIQTSEPFNTQLQAPSSAAELAASSSANRGLQAQATQQGKQVSLLPRLGDFSEFNVETSSTSKSEHSHRRRTTLKRKKPAKSVTDSLQVKARKSAAAGQLKRKGRKPTKASRQRRRSKGKARRAGKLRKRLNIVRSGRYYQEQSIGPSRDAANQVDVEERAVGDQTTTLAGETKGAADTYEGVKGGSGAASGAKKPFYSKRIPTSKSGSGETGAAEEESGAKNDTSAAVDSGGNEMDAGNENAVDEDAGEEIDDLPESAPRRVGDDDVEEGGDTVMVEPKSDGVDDDPDPADYEPGGPEENELEGRERENEPERDLSNEPEPRARRVHRDRQNPPASSGEQPESATRDQGDEKTGSAAGGGIGATMGVGASAGSNEAGSGGSEMGAQDEADEGEGDSGGSEGERRKSTEKESDDKSTGEEDTKEEDGGRGRAPGGSSGGKGSRKPPEDDSEEATGGVESATGSRDSDDDERRADSEEERPTSERRRPAEEGGAEDEAAGDVDYRDELEASARRKPNEERNATASKDGATRHKTTANECAHDDGSYNHHDEHHHHHHDTIRWLEEAVPGEPGKDYPILNRINSSLFKCADQKYPGYYADVEARCQVFHICQADGRQDSFLCPNGTIFSQVSTVCVWWNSFECEDAPKYYDLNGLAYKEANSKKSPFGGARELKPLDGSRALRPNAVAGGSMGVGKEDEESSIDSLIKAMRRGAGGSRDSGAGVTYEDQGSSLGRKKSFATMMDSVAPDELEETAQRKSNIADEDLEADTNSSRTSARLRSKVEPRRKRRASARPAPPKLKSRRVSRNSRRRKLRHGIKPKRRA